jgi:hypothetical protein
MTSEGDVGDDGAKGDSGIMLGTPLTAAPDTWTWVPFPDSQCANGTPTGLGVKLTGKPGARALIYLEGGGACWSDLTCLHADVLGEFHDRLRPYQFRG